MANFSRPPIGLWIILRVASVIVALLAILYSTGSLSGVWSLRLKYDVLYYTRIVLAGYQPGEVTANFHPLYPWIASLFAFVVRDPFLGLLVTSSLACLALTIAFYQLALLDCTPKQAWWATALLLCWPASAAIFVPYTEALFLLLSVLCLLATRSQRFWWAGLCGGLASLTRQHGLFLVLPVAWELLEVSKRDRRVRPWQWLSLTLIPLGYAAWILYRAFVIHDMPPDLSSLDGFIYSVMLSPAARELIPDQQFMMPWRALSRATIVLWSGSHWSAVGSFLLGGAFVALVVLGWKNLRPSYRVYSLVVVLVAFSYNTGPLDPYMALPRHLLPALPVFIGVAQAYEPARPWFLLGVLALCQMLVLCCFVWQTWVL
jgi:Gpi18-like mannosyltransferase